VQALFDEVLSDAEIQEAIETLAVDDADEEEKSLNDITRRLRDLLTGNDIADRIAEAIDDRTTAAAQDALEQAVNQTGEQADVDLDAITARLADREQTFANEFADRMAEQVRDTVADGFAEGLNSDEIGEQIAEQGDIAEGWQGAERIARQELQVATGEARSGFADELGKVEIWTASGDNRVRDTHDEMDGTWKYPTDAWVVDYTAEGRGVHEESVPGNSSAGIGCRCGTKLRDRDEVDSDDYSGTGTP